MKIHPFRYQAKSGWNIPEFPSVDSTRTLVLLFVDPCLEGLNEHLTAVSEHYPNSIVTGCTDAGGIFGQTLFDQGISAVAVQFERTDIKKATSQLKTPLDSYESGRQIARDLLRPDLKGIFLLTDGLAVNATDLLLGLQSVLPPDVVITGGLAGDGTRFTQTQVWDEGNLASSRVTAVGFYGQAIELRHGSRGGWRKFGIERKVTRSQGQVLFELDDKPALSLYKEYLGDEAQGLPGTGLHFPLTIYPEGHSEKAVVRTILGVDHKQHSMTFAGQIPADSMAQMMKASIDDLIDGATEAAQQCRDGISDSEPCLAISVSCVGRRLVLGGRAEDELDAMAEIFPSNTVEVGFYSYGGISPHACGSQSVLHNQTMTVTLLREG